MVFFYDSWQNGRTVYIPVTEIGFSSIINDGEWRRNNCCVSFAHDEIWTTHTTVSQIESVQQTQFVCSILWGVNFFKWENWFHLSVGFDSIYPWPRGDQYGIRWWIFTICSWFTVLCTVHSTFHCGYYSDCDEKNILFVKPVAFGTWTG